VRKREKLGEREMNRERQIEIEIGGENEKTDRDRAIAREGG